MKPASDALKALLASRQFFAARLFSFTTADGTVLRYCTGDRDITSGGNFFPAGGQVGPYFVKADDSSQCSWKIGLEAGSFTFVAYPGTATVNGVPFLQACENGVFDNAAFKYELAIMPTYGDVSAGTVVMFAGLVGPLGIEDGEVDFQIDAYSIILNQNVPSVLFQAGCTHSLFDGGCGLSKAAYAVTGALTAGSTVSVLNTGLTAATGYYDKGIIRFTSGANAGVSRPIKTQVGGQVSLWRPLVSAPTTGDAFSITPGCDKTTGTCAAKFSNLTNFGGCPTIPNPITAT